MLKLLKCDRYCLKLPIGDRHSLKLPKGVRNLLKLLKHEEIFAQKWLISLTCNFSVTNTTRQVFYFKVEQWLLWESETRFISKWGKVYFKVMSKWGKILLPIGTVISKWCITSFTTSEGNYYQWLLILKDQEQPPDVFYKKTS